MTLEESNESTAPYFSASQGGYTVIYNLTYSLNPYYEDSVLWEYGITCSLYDIYDRLVSEEHVNYISPNKNKVLAILYKLRDNKVFPVHLNDTVYDIINA